LPSTPADTEAPIALAAWAWVTTEQESNLVGVDFLCFFFFFFL
jgi:hypothetical protein